ncbi:MAG: HEAT repeat domain-containing protein [bacterium]
MPGSLGACALLALACTQPGCTSGKTAKGEDVNSIFDLFGPPTPGAAARDMVDPFDPDKRYRGMSRISAAPWGGEDVYVNIYAQAIQNDDDAGVRGVAAKALGNHGSPDQVKLILPLLKSPDPRVRQQAARALQRVHNTEAIGPLVEALLGRPDPDRPPIVGRPALLIPEPDKDVRAAAADALGQYADPVAAAALVKGLSDDDLLVSRNARRSLRTLTGKDFGFDAKAWSAFLATPAPFAGRLPYVYPAFSRDKYTWEYLPFWPEPPNESAASPTGYEPPAQK